MGSLTIDLPCISVVFGATSWEGSIDIKVVQAWEGTGTDNPLPLPRAWLKRIAAPGSPFDLSAGRVEAHMCQPYTELHKAVITRICSVERCLQSDILSFVFDSRDSAIVFCISGSCNVGGGCDGRLWATAGAFPSFGNPILD